MALSKEPGGHREETRRASDSRENTTVSSPRRLTARGESPAPPLPQLHFRIRTLPGTEAALPLCPAHQARARPAAGASRPRDARSAQGSPVEAGRGQFPGGSVTDEPVQSHRAHGSSAAAAGRDPLCREAHGSGLQGERPSFRGCATGKGSPEGRR